MNRLALLTAMALLGLGFTLAQNTQSTKPLSDQSNSSNVSPQSQSSAPTTRGKDEGAGALPNHREQQSDKSQTRVPDPTVEDRQSSTPSTTGAAGQDNNPPSRSTMGTTGSTSGASEPTQPQTRPQTGASPDQQPNPSTQPDATAPHAELLQTPAARAVATHTPDPGTCMNPAALQTSGDGTAAPPPCR